MNGPSRVYRLSPSAKYGLIVFSIVWMLIFGGMGLSVLRWGAPPDWVDAWTKYIHAGMVTFVFAIGGLGIVGLFNGIRALNDFGPKLTVTPEELIDHRAKDGVAHIRWAEVASVDCELWSSGLGGKLVVYVRDLTEIRTREVDLSGLDQSAEEIFVEIKKHLLMQSSGFPPKNIEVIHDLRVTEIAAGAPGRPRSRPEQAD